MSRPRVLIVSAVAFNHRSATGITLDSLFADWPDDALAHLHLDPGDPVRSLATHRLSVSAGLGPLGSAARLARGMRVVTPVNDRASNSSVTAPRRSPGTELRAGLDLLGGHLDRAARDFVRAVRPQVVYSVLGSATVMTAAAAAARVAGVPLVPHFMDDWPATRYAAGELGGLARRRMQAQLRSILAEAPVALTISDAMADDYAKRFDRDFIAAMNCIPDRLLAHEPPPPPVGPLRLVYVGGLHLGRGEQLRRLAAALAAVDRRARLVVHTPAVAEADALFAGLPNVEVGAPLSHDAVPAVLASAQVSVHVESSSPDLVAYTRLSISTKIPEYLAAARPILLLAPEQLASVRYVVDLGAGEAASDGATLTSALLRLQDAGHRAMLGAAAWRAAQAHAQSRVGRALAAELGRAAQVGH